MNDQSTYVGPTAAAKLAALAKLELGKKAGKDVATAEADGLMPAADKIKLDKINPDVLPTPVLDPTYVQALVVDKYTTAYKLATFDRLELPGAAESTNAPQTRSVKYALDRKASKDAATAEADGLMSASDKSKLDGIESGANKTIVDAALDASSTNSVQNKAVKAALDGKAGTAVATASANGLMSAADKTKLDGVEAGANKTTVDAALDAGSANPIQNKAVKAALDSKLSTRGGEISGNLDVGLTVGAGGSVSTGVTRSDSGIHFEKAASDAGRISHGFSEADGEDPPLARLKVASPTEDDDVTTKKYVDDRAVRYDAMQSLTFEQKQRARKNIEAADREWPTITGGVSLCPEKITDSNDAVHVTTAKASSDDFTVTLDCGPENALVRVNGIRTPTDANTNAAATVEYVKNKIAEAAASGGVDVDNALSATSTNPVQNKVITSALTGKAGTAVATTSANGLMSKADKTKLDGIAAGANKTDVDSSLSGESIRPVQNRVVKSALDGKLDKTGGTLTGNLTGKYITGTWLQTTEVTDLGRAPGKIAVLDDSGWVYYRTTAELLADIGSATVSAMLGKAYPVGSIYMSVNSTNPKTLFGGTWVQIKDKFLLATGTTYKAGSTGGEAAHTLTTNEMPNHKHAVYYPNAGAADHSAPGNYPDGPSDSTYYAVGSYTSSAGGDRAHNNMPPYLSVYMWKRTA